MPEFPKFAQTSEATRRNGLLVNARQTQFEVLAAPLRECAGRHRMGKVSMVNVVYI